MNFDSPAKSSVEVIQALVELQRSLGFSDSMQSNGINLMEFIDGYTCFAFPVSLLPMSNQYELLQTDECITNVTFKFKRGVPDNMNMYAIFITKGKINYNKDSTVTQSYACALP